MLKKMGEKEGVSSSFFSGFQELEKVTVAFKSKFL
jgi:hypothetical protein